jgi:hypothetical protein
LMQTLLDAAVEAGHTLVAPVHSVGKRASNDTP